MDTETVFKIINMLDARIKDRSENPLTQVSEYFELILFRDYLQEYIEAKVSQAEDQMNEEGY